MKNKDMLSDDSKNIIAKALNALSVARVLCGRRCDECGFKNSEGCPDREISKWVSWLEEEQDV